MLFVLLDLTASAVTVKGPDGYLLLWILGLLLFISLVLLLYSRKKAAYRGKRSFFSAFGGKRIRLELSKDRKYYPDVLTAEIINIGRLDVDIDQPMLIFTSFWMKRKFRLKGTLRHTFYPLFLESGKRHTLQIDLNHFYRHDRGLKRYPQVRLEIYEVGGRKLISRSVMLRKTLFR